MPSIATSNTNYRINGTDIVENRGLITKEYLIDVYPSLASNLKEAGLWAWGYNYEGTLGNGLNGGAGRRSSPVQTLAGGFNWQFVSAGKYHSSAIKSDGTLWNWGSNLTGELGDNSTVHRSSPIQTVAGGTNWKMVSAGAYHSTAVKTDGTLWLWGNNYNGRLGDGTNTRRSSPIQTIAGGTNWKMVSAGNYHTAATKTDGTLWCWGANYATGRLGDGTVTSRSSPVQTIAGGTNWKVVSCGAYSTMALKTDGTLWSWGSNLSGRLGDGTEIERSSPVQILGGGTNWAKISFGAYHGAAIKTDGTLWCWGNNFNGRLGDNTRTHRSSPVQTIAGGTNWKIVASGRYFTTALKADGTIWGWGSNGSGQLGLVGNLSPVSSPVQLTNGGTAWKLIAAGAYHTVAIRDQSDDPI